MSNRNERRQSANQECNACLKAFEAKVVAACDRARTFRARVKRAWNERPEIVALIGAFLLCVAVVWTVTVWHNAQDRLITATAAAARLGVSASSMTQLLRDHELPGCKDRFGHWRVRVQAVEDYRRRQELLK